MFHEHAGMPANTPDALTKLGYEFYVAREEELIDKSEMYTRASEMALYSGNGQILAADIVHRSVSIAEDIRVCQKLEIEHFL